MRMLSAAAVVVLLTAPVYAQTPNINLIPELKSMTPEEKEQEAAQQKAYKESLRKIPDAKGSSDPAGLPLSYRWSVNPSVDFKASGTKLNFVAPKSDKDVSYRFTLTLGNGSHNVTRDHSVTVKAESAGCQGPWSAQGTYMENDKVSHNGRLYTARWWSKGNEPGNPAFTGADGSGKVWRDDGVCN